MGGASVVSNVSSGSSSMIIKLRKNMNPNGEPFQKSMLVVFCDGTSNSKSI